MLVLGWLAAGCNVVLGLDEPRHSVPVDSDGDGVPDSEDDCPMAADPEQRDQDGDGIGDLCDNCPVVANAAQLTDPDDGDADQVGDECDSHPMDAGDCLVALESFADPTSLGAHWAIEPPALAGEVTVVDDGVRIANATVMQTVALVAPDLGPTPVTEPFDLQVMASATLTMNGRASVAAVSNYTQTPTGWFCAAQRNTDAYTVDGGTYGQASVNGPLSLDPQNDRVLLRLITTTRAGMPTMRCRLDYGGTVGAVTQSTTMGTVPPTGGAPGVAVTPDPTNPITIEAIAIYHFDPAGASCPPAIYY